MATPKKDPLLGTRIREYEILDIIGKGGMGAVYRARHIYLEEERAIKVIHSNLSDDRLFIDRFIREAKILTRLHHPNLVQLHEFGTLENDVFFMVLELLRGESAFHRMKRRGKLSVREALTIIISAANGLHSAHQQQVVHRDVSPDNLFLARTGAGGQEITKVIDFGIARPHPEGAQPLTATDTFLGKFEYASPEQCGMLTEQETIDYRTDIYSLGVTLYYLLAGRLPFYSPTAHGYIFKHITEQPKPVSEYADEIPKELDNIILKALSKKRGERQQSMLEFAKELEGVSASLGSASDAPTMEQAALTTSKLEFHPGEVFAGRYLIESKLGEGGMGVVYRAVDQMLDIRVALKMMGGHIIQDRLTVERLKREVILARKVSHHNACRIYDMGEYGNTHYVSMEYLEGLTLAQVVQNQGRLKLSAGIHIMKQVLSALHEAHRVGVIHRDLKPQNIMVDANDTAWIMDFGISTSTEVNKLTATGMIVGTPFYMAPEQLEGKEIDRRADIYASGVIMFQIFTGRLPFDAKSPLGVIAAHVHSKFPRVVDIVPGFPSDLDDIISKTLQKDPATRYQSAEELIRALESLDPQRILQAESTIALTPTQETMHVEIPAPPPSGVSAVETMLPIPAPAKPMTAKVKWIAAAVMALLGITVLWFALKPQPPDKPVPAITNVPVVINVLPWARARITPVSSTDKIAIPSEDQITPVSVLLPEGEYSLELRTDGYTEALTKRIIVKAGQPNSFQFTMPHYDAISVSEQFTALE